MEQKQNRKQLIRWAAWYFAINCPVAWIAAIAYLNSLFPMHLPHTKPLGVWMVAAFTITSYLSYLSLLVFIPFLIIILPLSIICPKKRLITPLAILINTFTSLFLFADSHIFLRYRFHINGALWRMIFSRHVNEIFALSNLEYLLIAGLLLSLLIVQTLLAKLVWRYWIKRSNTPRIGSLLTGLCCGCLLGSYFTFTYTMAVGINEFTTQTKALPYYTQIIGQLVPLRQNLFHVENFAAGKFFQLKQATAPLQYPLQAMNCKPPQKLPNILIIAIDTWRFDSITPQVMPHMHKLAAQTLQFKQHYSGGNSTKAGIFSLFYALPVTYWTSMLQQRVSPVFIDLLQQYHYQMEILASAELEIPAFNKTIFQNIKNLATTSPGKTAFDRDRYITKTFIKFIKQSQHAKQPFFSFLFYDGAHAYCLANNIPHPFQPYAQPCNRLLLNNKSDPTPYINRYHNAVHFVDSEVAQVISTLKKRKLWNNTIVIITGDHGQEFNDNKQNYWEHAGNYTHYQVQTPLLIHWPGKSAQQFNYQTSHYDIVPTLLHRVLNCTTPATAYSIGHDLFTPYKRAFLLVGSYINFAIIEPHRIVTFYQSGHTVIQDQNAKPLPTATVDLANMRAVLTMLRQFYRN